MKTNKILTLLIATCLLVTLLSGCSKNKKEKIIDIIQEAETVIVKGVQADTVEASLGAFEGKQGDYIEFRFDKQQTFNTIFITEKTATIRQYNIYAEIDGKTTLIFTGKHILNENITLDETTASAIKLEVVNTQIGNDHFVIQGVSAYNIPKGE